MKALKLLLWMAAVLGLIYPLCITAISFLLMPDEAKGSLLVKNKTVIGSLLIGQNFYSDKYFWGRPSVSSYNPLPSKASNLGPTSKELKKRVQDGLNKWRELSTKTSTIPSELIFASGSGLDPHISIRGAYFQMERISRERGIEKESLKQLIDAHVEKRKMGLLGYPIVNVLQLNLRLDQFQPEVSRKQNG